MCCSSLSSLMSYPNPNSCLDTFLIYCSNFHFRYNLPSVTSQMARRTFETAAMSLPEGQKSLVADYLTHSSAAAEKHYCLEQCTPLVKTTQLLSTMGRESRWAGFIMSTQCKRNQAHHNLFLEKWKSSVFLIISFFYYLIRPEPSEEATRHESSEEGSSHGDRGSAVEDPSTCSSENARVKFYKAYETLLQTYPLSLNGKRPKVNQRRDVSQGFERKLYTYWAKEQFEMRVKHIRCKYFPTIFNIIFK